MIVYTLEDLKEVYDQNADGVKGQWYTHTNMHQGHVVMGEVARDRADWLMGIYWANWASTLHRITGEKARSIDPEEPLQYNIDNMSQLCDVLFISTGDYFPFTTHLDYLNAEIDNNLYSKEVSLGDSTGYNWHKLLFSIRALMHDTYKIKNDFQISTGRLASNDDYKQWNMDRFGLEIMTIDLITDNLGNSYSYLKNKLSENLLNRINKQLLYPHYKTIEEIEQNIQDVDGLHVSEFVIKDGWSQCRFYFKPDQSWTAGIQCS